MADLRAAVGPSLDLLLLLVLQALNCTNSNKNNDSLLFSLQDTTLPTGQCLMVGCTVRAYLPTSQQADA
jgi:hypothetical protein